jgi:amino acid adenylation domain-containing protein
MNTKSDISLDFLDNYLEKMLFNNKFFIADLKSQVSNQKFTTIINSIAHEINKKKSNKQLSIVILLDRSIEYIASMFASWKINSYFIPLNTNWPKERIKTIISHCEADIVICSKRGNYHEENSLYIEDINFNEDKKIIKTTISKPSDLAYIIYTSGSTGIPKGVMISNESYLHYVKWTKRFFSSYRNNKALLLTAELTFDITMGDIAFSLAFGTSIVVSPDPKNMISHIKLINKYSIDTFYSVPTTHNALFNFVKRKKSISVDTINLILSGGDSFSVELIKTIKNVVPKAHFYNVYGPTEITINCFATRVDNLIGEIEKDKLVPIGKPFDIIDAVIINDDEQDITNENTVGKLFVSGPQTMLGYLDDDEKTESTFILDSRYPKFKRKIYNTGDLAIKKENGLFYLLGRSDDIVKIKGYRVNPTEINNVLSTYEYVKDCTVFVVKEEKIYILIAYLVTTEDVNEDEVKMFLAKYLPEYMIPNKFIYLKTMPLNNSGKIDKKELKLQYKKGNI